ncbi:MAG: hypothetical protein ACI4RA_05510 [Kiritimatiellia bacterium]
MITCTLCAILAVLAAECLLALSYVVVRRVLAERDGHEHVPETLMVGFQALGDQTFALPPNAGVKLRFVGKLDEERVELVGVYAPEAIERNAECGRIARLNPHHRWFPFEVHRFDLDEIPVQTVEICSYGPDGHGPAPAIMDPERDHFVYPAVSDENERAPDGKRDAGGSGRNPVQNLRQGVQKRAARSGRARRRRARGRATGAFSAVCGEGGE